MDLFVHKYCKRSIPYFSKEELPLTSKQILCWIKHHYAKKGCLPQLICHTHHPVFQIIVWMSEDKNIWDYCHFFPHPHVFFRFLLLIPSLFICYMVLIGTKSHGNNGWLHLVKDHSTLVNFSQLDQCACKDIGSPLPSSAVHHWKYMISLRGCHSWNFWVVWSSDPRSITE